MATMPDDVFFALDLENASGTVQCEDAYAEALACSQATAQLQWNMWYGGVGRCGWRCLAMEEGVCQGGRSALQDFALGFQRAQRTVQFE
eukprot:510201-Alexandrium_andersonii.AAC.1